MTSAPPRHWRAKSPQFGWANRARFYPRLTSLDEAVARALAVGRDPSLPALAFADVADNPGGGGRGNTMFLLRALYEAGVEGAHARRLLRSAARRRGASARVGTTVRRAFQPIGDHQILGTVDSAGDGRGADRRQLRRAARHLCRDAARARAVRGVAGRRRHGRRRLASGAMRRPGVFRDDGARHRPRRARSSSSRAAISAAASTSSSAPTRSSRSTCPA